MIGEDPNDIQRIWTKLLWAGASVGRSGLATQAIAAIDIALWDLKAKRAGLPLAKFLGRVPRFGALLTTPLAASCRPRSKRSWTTRTPQSSGGSAASRSRSANLIRGST